MGPLSMKGTTAQELAWICRFFVGDPILLVGVPALPVLYLASLLPARVPPSRRRHSSAAESLARCLTARSPAQFL